MTCLDLLPAALLPALIVANTVVSDRSLILDARIVGVGVAAFLTWKKAPFPVIVGLAAAAGVAAALRPARRAAKLDILDAIAAG